MLFGVHLLAGAAIGANVPQVAPAMGLALFSHYALDHLPHWNYLPKYRSTWEDTWKMLIEPLISIPLFILAAWYFKWDVPIILAGFAATIPDVVEGLQYFINSKVLKPVTRWHHWGHWHAQLLPSLPIALIIIFIALWALPLEH